MCEPVTIGFLTITATQMVMGGIAAAAAAASAVSSAKKGQAQADALGKQRQAQSDEIQAQNEGRIGERVKAARAERARLRVAAGEGGVAGASFEAQLMDSAFQQDFDIATISRDNKFAQRASQARTDSGLAGTIQPNKFATGLQIASAGVTAGASVA